jgi:hypothetical protein
VDITVMADQVATTMVMVLRQVTRQAEQRREPLALATLAVVEAEHVKLDTRAVVVQGLLL